MYLYTILNKTAFVFFLLLTLTQSLLIGSDKKKSPAFKRVQIFKRLSGQYTKAEIPTEEKESVFSNPLYEKKENPSLIVFYQIPNPSDGENCSTFVTKEEFDQYKKNYAKNSWSLVKRLTYLKEGREVVYSWEKNALSQIYQEKFF